jgi:3-oxoacyl-(acyl-carrier-protein) synthase
VEETAHENSTVAQAPLHFRNSVADTRTGVGLPARPQVPSRRAVAVTAFYAAWRVGTGWREIRSSPGGRAPQQLQACCEAVGGRGSHTSRLRSLQRPYVFEGSSRSDAEDERQALPPKNYRAQPDVLRSRLRDELAGCGLWDRGPRRLLCDPEMLGLAFSSSKGFWPQKLEEQFFDVVDWLCCDGAARALARAIGSQGPILSPVSACATGSHAIALGAGWIEDGRCDVVVAGAVERPLEPLVQAGYGQLGAMSRSGQMRPYDIARDGFVPNAGMGFLVLEDAERARARGAEVHAYLAGHALNADATAPMTLDPSGSSIVRAIDLALKSASRGRNERTPIDYINTHGTGTLANDLVEARALNSVFGEAARERGDLALASSTKPLTGHLMGAAGAVEAALCVQALKEGFAPPTLGIEEPDPECAFTAHERLAPWLAQGGVSAPLRSALSLSYGFGGHMGALLFTRPGAEPKPEAG